MRIKRTIKQRGDHHAALIVGAVVVLAGVLGFVGYNSWQNQSANAGGCLSKFQNDLVARRNCLQARETQIGQSITQYKSIRDNTRAKQSTRDAAASKVKSLTNEFNDLDNRISALNKQIAAKDRSRQESRGMSKRVQAAEKDSGSKTSSTSVSSGISTSDCLRLGRVAIGSSSCEKRCSNGERIASGYPYDYCPSVVSPIAKSICDTNRRQWANVSKGSYCKNGSSSCVKSTTALTYVRANPYNKCVPAGTSH